MDALILSCGTGGGHDAAGRAIAEELSCRGHRVAMLNPYTLHSTALAERINRVYITMAQKAPELFGLVYHAGQLYRKLPFRSPVYFANGAMVPVLQAYLEHHHTDVILMPHVFPAEILTNMKQRGLEIPATIFVATDYVCIPFTEETDCDAYVIPSETLAEDFVNRGIPAEKLHPLGIPTSCSFRTGESKAAARERLGLEPDRPYVLVTGGSMGGGKIARVIDFLLSCAKELPQTGFLIICGSNERLAQQLRRMQLPNVTVLGYTNEMAGYMRAADLLITKPGGLSSTEAAVSGIPMVQTAAIPGCETTNAAFFSQHGMSLACAASKKDLRKAMELLGDLPRQEAMLEQQKRWIAPDAAVKICELAEQMGASREKDTFG